MQIKVVDYSQFYNLIPPMKNKNTPKPSEEVRDVIPQIYKTLSCGQSIVPNMYEHLPPDYLKKRYNPRYNFHHIDLPSRILIIGASGGKKTSTCCYLLNELADSFHNISVFTADKDEPLYQHLGDTLKDKFKIYEGLKKLPFLSKNEQRKVEGWDITKSQCIVFDDMILNNLDAVKPYWIRGRKIGTYGFTVFFISQSFFKIPLDIRQNSNYVILRKITSDKDVCRCLREYGDCGADRSQLLAMYAYATEGNSFLLIDVSAEPNKRYRKGLLEIITPLSFPSTLKK